MLQKIRSTHIYVPKKIVKCAKSRRERSDRPTGIPGKGKEEAIRMEVPKVRTRRRTAAGEEKKEGGGKRISRNFHLLLFHKRP